ncbi:uncharacterized protein LOC129718110 [Wyeomyia smithii]|uniref:uncharacterized protein LOC129718110 n=1 Tax=Wyeomyia smithii TaxID=174621 RepID=UPI002467FD7B|nr:uncharacterized protein LOC129718110 [Wyeomyia smithii]
MTVNEKTPLVPQEYQKKSYVISIPQEDYNNNTTTSLISEYDTYALTKDELAKFIDDPFWNRVRQICFFLYWLICLVALAISCYIAASALEAGFCETTNNGAFSENMTTVVNTVAADSATQTATGDIGIILRLLSQPS